MNRQWSSSAAYTPPTMAATELGTSGCSPARRTSSVRIVSVSASVVDAKTPHSSIVSWGAPSGESAVLATPRPVRSDLMWDRRFPMWDMRLPFCIRVPTTVGCRSAERRSGLARLSACCLTMRGARRSHNTIARTADRHPQSARAVIRTAPRDRSTGCTAGGSARPAPTTQSRSINDGADRSLADAPGAREDRALVLHRRRRLTEGPRREARPPERAPRLLLSMQRESDRIPRRQRRRQPVGSSTSEAAEDRVVPYARAHASAPLRDAEGARTCNTAGGARSDDLSESSWPSASGLIGAAGFEPATSCSQSRRATRLRHAPSDGKVRGRDGLHVTFG